MKAIIIILLLGICLSYDFYYPIAAIKYALKYCKNYNPDYNNYKLRKDGANFVSQCMYNAGQSFDGCAGRDKKGMIRYAKDLKECLISKGWRTSSTKHLYFRPGHPVFIKSEYSIGYPALCTGNDGKYIYISSHDPDLCDTRIEPDKLDYYFKDVKH